MFLETPGCIKPQLLDFFTRKTVFAKKSGKADLLRYSIFTATATVNKNIK